MADYNVNMKQWNGSSFDNVLPLAYNAKQLEGKSLAEVKQWVQDNGLLLYTGQYTGTGTYGVNNGKSVVFPFEPIIFFTPIANANSSTVLLSNNAIIVSALTETFNSLRMYGMSLDLPFFKKSSDSKTISWYGSSVESNFNVNGIAYYFAAIGGYDMGGQTEWAITSSGTWTVPRTGRYYIELYGYGGAGKSSGVPYASGGASCQSYDSVVLTKGQVINVTIAINEGTTTSFDSYTVTNAGNASTESPYYGTGSGNKGKNGAYSYSGHTVVTVGGGVLSANYGVGQSSQNPYATTGRYGAVYLKYLGA